MCNSQKKTADSACFFSKLIFFDNCFPSTSLAPAAVASERKTTKIHEKAKFSLLLAKKSGSVLPMNQLRSSSPSVKTACDSNAVFEQRSRINSNFSLT